MSLDTIFVNLPVKDLERTVAFYESLGLTRHPVFHGPGAICVSVSEHIHLMLQTAENLRRHTQLPIVDPAQATGVMLCLHGDSPAHVDELIRTAEAAGGTPDPETVDIDFCYSRGFTDPEGYLWKINYIYPAK